MSTICYTRNEDDCPICGCATDILNVGRDHFAVCYVCEIQQHIGSNLFSGWLNETPETWAANRNTLDEMAEYEPPPTAPGFTDSENIQF